MKSLLSALLLLSFSAFASETVIEPSIVACDKETLRNYVKPDNRSTVTMPKNIKIEPREIGFGDPAIWSLLHVIKVEFPVALKTKKACFLIDKAYLNSVKSVGHDAKSGRLLEMSVSVATGDADGNIGSKDIKLKVRVNQASGKLSIEK
ncbi:MAG: hypothetical protein H0V66_05535 [Bdellovibrionales bacterium]|nr:hypothetical protein [Bdellovibrionales bacterium]